MLSRMIFLIKLILSYFSPYRLLILRNDTESTRQRSAASGILALHGDDVFRARIRAERTIGVAVGGDDGSVLVKAAKHFGSGFTDMHKVGAGNNDAGVVEHVDRLSDIFFKLIDYALKYSC